MDAKEFYARKAQLLANLCDALLEVQEISLQLTSLERKVADPDDELHEELGHLHRKSHDFESYMADQYMAVAPMIGE